MSKTKPEPSAAADAAPVDADSVKNDGADNAAESAATACADEESGPAEIDVEALQEEVLSLKDQLLRALAETENIRRRAERDRQDATRYAVSDFARDMLAVADDLGRAMDNLPDGLRADDAAAKPLVDGVEMTQRNLDAAFSRHAIGRIDPIGERFDHNFHEAMFEVETADADPGTVVQVIQCGYRIHDRLLRPARVGVAKRPTDENAADA